MDILRTTFNNTALNHLIFPTVTPDSTQNLCAARKASLEESCMFYQFLQNTEEEEAWLVEKIRIVKSQDVGKDLRTCLSLIKKHQV